MELNNNIIFHSNINSFEEFDSDDYEGEFNCQEESCSLTPKFLLKIKNKNVEFELLLCKKHTEELFKESETD